MFQLSRLCAWWLLWLSTFMHSVEGERQITLHDLRLRNATLEDAEDIATTIIAAFDPLRDRDYLFPFRHVYPEEHLRCMKLGVTRSLLRPSAYAQVIEAPRPSRVKLAAIAIWTQNTTRVQENLHELSTECMHRDLNITRAIAWERDFNAAKQQAIDGTFGSTQLYLDTLATYPDHQRKGFGTELLNEGINIGIRQHINVTLLAEPTATNFYLHAGFSSLGRISIVSVDHDEEFHYDIMKFKSAHKPAGGKSG